MKIDCFLEVCAARTDRQTLWLLGLLSEPKKVSFEFPGMATEIFQFPNFLKSKRMASSLSQLFLTQNWSNNIQGVPKKTLITLFKLFWSPPSTHSDDTFNSLRSPPSTHSDHHLQLALITTTNFLWSPPSTHSDHHIQHNLNYPLNEVLQSEMQGVI